MFPNKIITLWVTEIPGPCNHMKKSGQVRSRQVRSECLTCTIRVSCCSARLSRAQVPAFAGSSVRDWKRGGGGGGEGVRADRLHWWVQGSTSSPTGISSRQRVIKKWTIIKGERERNILFNDALNTFYLRLYGVRHMVKDHSDREKGNPLPPHRLLLSINSKGSFICTIPQTG